MRSKNLVGPILLLLLMFSLLVPAHQAAAAEWVDHYDASNGYLYAGEGTSTITFDDWGYSGPGPGGKPENGRNAKQFAPINGFGTLGQRQHVATLWPDRLTPDDPHSILKDMTNSPEYTNANMDAQVNFYLWGYTSPGFDRQSSWEAYSAYRAEDYSGSVHKGSLFNNMLIDLDGDYFVSKNDMHFNYYDGFSYVDATGANPPESVATSLSFQPYPISDAIGWCGSVMASHPAACAVMAGQLTFDFAFDVYFTDPDQPGRSFMGTQIVPGFQMRSYGSLNVHVWVGNVLQSYSSNAVVNNTNPATADRWDVDPAYYSNVSFHGGGVLPNRVWVSADSFNADGSKKLNPDGTWNVTVVPEGTPGAHSHDNAFAGYAFILRADGIRLLDYFNEEAYGPDPCTNVNCDDNNVCTTDSCVGGLCIHANNTLPCSDNNACTTGDVCSNGACKPGAPTDCYDGKTCTIDSCDPAIGCVNTPIPGCGGGCSGKPDGTPCEDGNPCTDHDTCVQGVCSSGPVRNCDDGNVCTDDFCSGGACVHVNNTLPCNDGNACTTGDICSNGVCAGTPRNCDDGNVCTFDSCDTVTGNCVYTFNHSRCNDGNACTSGDVCSNGVCAGTPRNCDDGDACTLDSCDTATGICAHAQLPGCVTEQLHGRLLIENGTYFCMGSPYPSGSCVPFVGGDDGGLLLGQYQPMQLVPGACGNVTGNGQGTGYSLPGDGGGSQVIAKVFDFFGVPTYPSTNAESWQACTPHNPPSVTAGAVDPVTGCRTLTGEISAWDVLWNGAEFEQGPRGGTPAKPVPTYATGKLCPDNSYDLSWPALIVGGPFNAVTGYWLIAGHLNQCATATCNDGNVCTDDSFDPVTCQCGHAFNTKPCDDQNPGTVQDRCSNGVCAGIPAGCDDNNVCTDDGVDPVTGACINTFNTAPCNDGNPCTVNDTCAGGVCAGTPKNCNIGNPCTADSCDAATGTCLHTWFCNLPDPLPAGTKLLIEQGVGSGLNAPCSTGSCFGMEINPGFITWTDYGPGTDGGFVLGKDQASGSQELDGSITDPGELSNAWFFFGAYGSFYTSPDGGTTNRFDKASCSGTGCFGKTELKVLNVGWNGGIIPMGSAAGCTLPSCTPDELAGIFVNDYHIEPVTGGAWSMNYAQVVPTGSFQRVKFSNIIRGTVVMPDLCAAVTCNPAKDCTSAGVCNSSTGICVYSNVPDNTACTTDGNPCTDDICQGGVCQHINNTAPCNADNNLCTQNDACAGGVCVAGPLKNCQGTNTCKTYPACVPSTGLCPTATNKTVGTACDDGNACTVNDKCAAGGVCKGTTNFCRDTDPCTEDACTAGTGVCTHTAVGTPGVCGMACATPVPNDWTLRITPGRGSGTNTPCSTGSCFSMVNGSDVIWTDILPGTDGGFWVGHPQASGGQELTGGGSVSTSGALTVAWNFFNAEGTFFTSPDGGSLNKFCGASCSGYDCLNKTELKVFTVAWNGGPILMGSAAGCVLSNCSIQQKNDVMVNNWSIDPTNGGAWSMDYAQVVPVGSFQNVNFKAILRGTVQPSGCQGCTIGGICYDNVTVNPANLCQVCDTAQSTSAWSNKANGTPCPGVDLCSGEGTCQNGICVQPMPIACPPPPVCKAAGVCNSATGTCTYANLPNGTSCSDGNWCNGEETCQGGVCTPGIPPSCPTLLCQVGTCNPVTGCSYTNKSNGTNCDDGNLCNGIETCQSGVCVAGVPVTCPAPTVCITVGACVPSTGVCPVTNKSDGTACSDNNACTSGDTCQGGVCTPGIPVTCPPPPVCKAGNGCDPATGICSYTNLPNGTPCGPLDLCSGGEATCQNGICVQPLPIVSVCPPPTACTIVGACNPLTGICPVTNKSNGTSCDDGDLCNGVSTCQNGACLQTTPPIVCPSATACTTVGACVPSTGICPVANKSNGTNCDDGNLCNGVSTCVSGLCTQTTPPVICPGPSACTIVNACVPSTGLCPVTNKTNGTSCDDGNLCNGIETCQSGVCRAGTPVTCPAATACTTVGACVPSTGICPVTNKSNGTSCDDGNLCNGVSTCQSGACTQTTPPVVCPTGQTCNTSTGVCGGGSVTCTSSNVGAACNDGNECTTNDKCVQISSGGKKPTYTYACKGTTAANGTACTDDGNKCTTDTCQSGVCTHTAKVCNPTTTGGQCTTSSCDTADGLCKTANRPNGTACNDGNACTTNDSCQNGICSGTAKVCTALDQCHTAGVCSTSTGVCSNPTKANGTACNDGNLCTTNDTCQGGTCKGTAVNCNDHNICTLDSCNTATGACVHTPIGKKSTTLVGDLTRGETAAINNQIQTSFTADSAPDHCIVSLTNNAIYVTPGTQLTVSCKVGTGPLPTTIKMDGVSMPTNLSSGSVTCATAATSHSIYLDNLKASGGKDVDNLYVFGNSQD